MRCSIALLLLLAVWGGSCRRSSESTAIDGTQLFGFPAVDGFDRHLAALDELLPPGTTQLALGMSRKEVKKLRAPHYRGEKMEGLNQSLIELHDSAGWTYAKRHEIVSSVPMDRLEVSFDAKGGRVSTISLNSQYSKPPTREMILAAMDALVAIYGPPTHVFDLKGSQEVGLDWIAEQGRVRLWFRKFEGVDPIMALSIEDATDMKSDTPLNEMVAGGKVPPPADLAGFLGSFFERAYPATP